MSMAQKLEEITGAKMGTIWAVAFLMVAGMIVLLVIVMIRVARSGKRVEEPDDLLARPVEDDIKPRISVKTGGILPEYEGPMEAAMGMLEDYLTDGKSCSTDTVEDPCRPLDMPDLPRGPVPPPPGRIPPPPVKLTRQEALDAANAERAAIGRLKAYYAAMELRCDYAPPSMAAERNGYPSVRAMNKALNYYGFHSNGKLMEEKGEA